MPNTDMTNIFGLYTQTYHLPAGTTLTISPLAGQNAAVLNFVTGGSYLLVCGNTTTIGNSYVVSNNYPMSPGSILNLDLSGEIMLVGVGATATFGLLRGRTAGY